MSNLKLIIAIALAAAALVTYGQVRHPKNTLPVNGHPILAQGPPPPICPPRCPPPKPPAKRPT